MVGNEKYVADIKKYTSHVNEAAVAGIVRHLGIALRNRDSSLVASSDPEELKRVRDSWLKKKLGLSETDAELESAVKTVVDKMKADRMKERVTVYYLLAKHFNKLDVFAKPPVSTAKTSAPKADAGKRAGGHTKKSA